MGVPVVISVPVCCSGARQRLPEDQKTRRAALGLVGSTLVLLSSQQPVLASYSDVANQKRLEKAQLLENSRAQAEGRAPRQLVPAAEAAPSTAQAKKTSAAGAPTAAKPAESPVTSFSDTARERSNAKAALLAEARAKAIAAAGNPVKSKK